MQIDKRTEDRLRTYLDQKRSLFTESDYLLIEFVLESKRALLRDSLLAISDRLSDEKERERSLKQKIQNALDAESDRFQEKSPQQQLNFRPDANAKSHSPNWPESKPGQIVPQLSDQQQEIQTQAKPEQSESQLERADTTADDQQKTKALVKSNIDPTEELRKVIYITVSGEIADLKKWMRSALLVKNQEAIQSNQDRISEQITKLETRLNETGDLIYRELDDHKEAIADLEHKVDALHNELEKIHARFDEFDRKTLEEVGIHKHRAEVAEQDARLAQARADETLKTFRYQLGRKLLPSLSAAMKPEFSVHNAERGQLMLDRLREILDVLHREEIIE